MNPQKPPDAPPTKRRWFRFSLRTLLIVVALAAVASWGYWIGWPWWVVYREQVRFEQKIKQLKVGSTLDDVFALTRGNNPPPYPAGSIGRYVMFRYEWPNEVYYVFMRFSPKYSLGLPCESVEVFRLQQPPYDYVEHEGLGVKSSNLTPHSSDYESTKMAYFNDFQIFVNFGRQAKPGFQYELIYSEPPQNDKPH